jgi:hypothetical protein
MESELCAGQLRSFIAQVVDYYRISNIHRSGPVVFTLKMAAFALPSCSQEQVAECIQEMADDGVVTIVREEPLSFSPNARFWHV